MICTDFSFVVCKYRKLFWNKKTRWELKCYEVFRRIFFFVSLHRWNLVLFLSSSADFLFVRRMFYSTGVLKNMPYRTCFVLADPCICFFSAFALMEYKYDSFSPEKEKYATTFIFAVAPQFSTDFLAFRTAKLSNNKNKNFLLFETNNGMLSQT